MNIEDFLNQFVEGYLLCDLESMANVKVAPEGYGGVGYPMVATTLAGMELLGYLLMPSAIHFDVNKGNEYFLNFWDNYFTIRHTQYSGLGRLFRQLMRNGIAHSFVAKPGIFIEKGSNKQMSIDTERQEIYLDCIVFYMEFRDVYTNLVLPVVNGVSAANSDMATIMQTQLNSLSEVYSSESVRCFSSLPPLHDLTHNTGRRANVPVSSLLSHVGARSSGASLPFGMSGPLLSSDATGTTTTTTTRTSSMEGFVGDYVTASPTLPMTTVSGTMSPKPKP